MTSTDAPTTAAPSAAPQDAPAEQAPKSEQAQKGAVTRKHGRADGKSSQVVSFRLGGEEYGVDIMTVQEIILLGCITQVPEVPDHVLGVINLRGNVIPILNLRRRFGMDDRPSDESTRIVVMNLKGRTVGVVVDGVSEVLRLSEDEVSPTPPSLAYAGKDYVTGLARRKDRLLILLDMARLLGSSELGEINQVSKGES